LVVHLQLTPPTLLRSPFPHKVPEYIPNWTQCVDHFALHAGGYAVLKGLQSAMRLPSEKMLPSFATLRDYGNTSCSTTWYVLAYMETCTDVRQGQTIMQIGMGGGMKVRARRAAPGLGAWAWVKGLSPGWGRSAANAMGLMVLGSLRQACSQQLTPFFCQNPNRRASTSGGRCAMCGRSTLRGATSHTAPSPRLTCRAPSATPARPSTGCPRATSPRRSRPRLAQILSTPWRRRGPQSRSQRRLAPWRRTEVRGPRH
jgi:hypothetical protein